MTQEHPSVGAGEPDDNRARQDTAAAAAEAHEKSGPPEPSPAPPAGPPLRTIARKALPFLLVFWLGSVLGGHAWSIGSAAWRAVFGTKSESEEASSQYYTCGMHPWVILPKAGDCPICGMKLVPLDPAKFTGEVTINPVVAQNVGVRVSEVTRGEVVQTIRTVGTVTYDETRVRDVNIKVGGWIENLHVDYMGAEVHKGQSLFELYSPELFVTQGEYLQAWKSHDKAKLDPAAAATQGPDDVLASTRKKLEYFDITDKQIEALQKRGEASKTMTIQSPFDGVVIAKNAVEGMKVNEGTQVFRIADLSKIWVLVTIYEYQLPYVQLGQTATMSLTYLPGQKFEGKVIYIYPYLNDKTRQVDLRLEFENPSGVLKPGMYANIDLHSTLARDRTLAPRSAIIDTGERKVAFVSLGEGRFEPRDIQTGIQAQGSMIEVLYGLKPGEKVVTSAQFLIDSEANVRSALTKMIKGDLASDQEPTVAVAGSSQLNSLPENASKALLAMLDAYLAIHKNLSADTFEGISTPARQIAEKANELIKIEIPEDPHFWHKHDEVAAIRAKALEAGQAGSLEEARLAFADLSFALDKLIKATGVPGAFGKELQELHCPMYREGQGGTIWLQISGEVLNPYFGESMPGCFDQRNALPVTGRGEKETSPKKTMGGLHDKDSNARKGADASTGKNLGAEFQTHVDELIRTYLKVHALLAQDKYDEVPALAALFQSSAEKLVECPDQKVSESATKAVEVVARKFRNLDEARRVFKDISLVAIGMAEAAPPDASVAPVLYHVHCPMTKGDWLQTTTEIRNPYYGQQMLACGEVVGRIDGRVIKDPKE